LWKSVPANKRKEMLEGDAKEDGEFWMSFSDMKKHFTHFEICSISMDEMYEDDGGKSAVAIVTDLQHTGCTTEVA